MLYLSSASIAMYVVEVTAWIRQAAARSSSSNLQVVSVLVLLFILGDAYMASIYHVF